MRIGGVFLTVVAVAAAAVACDRPESTPAQTESPQDGAAPDSVRDQVLAVVEQYYADLSDRDWPNVRAHFWPGATLTTTWQPPGEPVERVVMTTIEAFIDQAPQGPGSRAVFSEAMTSAIVRGNNDLAQVWAAYDARFGDPGDIQEWSGIDAITLLRFEGRWRISSIAYATTEGGPR
jgi:hypothetical protein